MRICIKMINGNIYIVEDDSVLSVVDRLSDNDFLIIPGTENRDDFAINTVAVSAIYPARSSN